MIDVYPLLEEKGGIKRFSNCDYDTLPELNIANTTEYSLRGMNVFVWPNPKHLHIALTQLEMPHWEGGGGGYFLIRG